MAFVTRSNEAALFALRGLNAATDLFGTATRRLATGYQVERPSDSPAGFGIATRFRARLSSLETLSDYNQVSNSLVQTASSGLESILDQLREIRTKALSSINSTLTTADRNANQTEVTQLLSQIGTIASTTQFNSRNLIDGTYATGRATLTFQVGADSGNVLRLNIRTSTASALGVSSVSVSTQAAATSALTRIDSAINLVITSAASLGAVQNRLTSIGDFIDAQIEAHEGALGAIVDADLGKETVNLALASLLRQTSSAALAQANLFPQDVLAAILPQAR